MCLAQSYLYNYKHLIKISNLGAAATLEPDQLRPLAVMEEPQKLLLQELKFQQSKTRVSRR